MPIGENGNAVFGHPNLREVLLGFIPGPHRVHGGEVWAKCPFHGEDTPSFKIDSRGWFHCFGCNTHGGALDLVMETSNIGPHEAFEVLAGKLGLNVKKTKAKRLLPKACYKPDRKLKKKHEAATLSDLATSLVRQTSRHRRLKDVKKRKELGEQMDQTGGKLRTLMASYATRASWQAFAKSMRLETTAASSAVSSHRSTYYDLPKIPLIESQQRLAKTNEVVWESLFKPALSKTPHAVEYLHSRGFTDLSEFGWAPPEATAILSVMSDSHTDPYDAFASGLFVSLPTGNVYPRFCARIVVPIRDQQGNIRGFGGRTLSPQVKAKYVNTRETLIFKKGELLFNLHSAFPSIVRRGWVLVVEGYTDALSCVAAGIPNVVALMGTAVTSEHAKLLRLCGNVVMCLDGDRAGRLATLRSFMPFMAESVWPLEVQLPMGEDPDSYVRRHGKDELLKATEVAIAVFYRWLSDVQAKDDALAGIHILKLLDEVNDPFMFDVLVDELERCGAMEKAESTYSVVGPFHVKKEETYVEPYGLPTQGPIVHAGQTGRAVQLQPQAGGL